jgi:hypothetical protein
MTSTFAENSESTAQESNDVLVDWLDALEFYARDWDATFGSHSHYFTQEYWYLFINCLRAHWAGRPLTVSQLAQAMKTGSNRTREERIRRAVDDGYLVKERIAQDGRAAIVRPTPLLEELMLAHLKRTRDYMASKIE